MALLHQRIESWLSLVNSPPKRGGIKRPRADSEWEQTGQRPTTRRHREQHGQDMASAQPTTPPSTAQLRSSIHGDENETASGLPIGDNNDESSPKKQRRSNQQRTSYTEEHTAYREHEYGHEYDDKNNNEDQNEEDDSIRTPKGRLHHRPFLGPQSQPVRHGMKPPRIERPRSTSPVKTISDLSLLEKPVSIVALGTVPVSETVLPDVFGLYKDIRDISQYSGFVPAEIREEFTGLLAEADVAKPWWFKKAGDEAQAREQGRRKHSGEGEGHEDPNRLAGQQASEEEDKERESERDTKKQALLLELYGLYDIHLEAVKSKNLGRHEAAWNSAVQHPLLNLALNRLRHRPHLPGQASSSQTGHIVRAENVSYAQVSGDCLPRLQNPKAFKPPLSPLPPTATSPTSARSEGTGSSALGVDPLDTGIEQGDDAEDAATTDTRSVVAWSISQDSSTSGDSDVFIQDASSTYSSARGKRAFSQVGRQEAAVRHPDATVHSRSGSKKVDFALVVQPGTGTALHMAIRAILGRIASSNSTSCSQSVNPFTYSAVADAPIATAIEVKTVTASKDPLIQLGTLSIAIHRRLYGLRIAASAGEARARDRIVTLPLISVTDHRWDMYFACDRRQRVGLPSR
ncbi:hypothetical protein VM1G_10823 [Cytospora mali]|uniref:PD-(D/E)XK nuclease-like domain-containing protein n=1 Tax=Cytospora mali TaxID=578113 RepID=A0A194VIS5_CYTMA|nr:hypothetical protein VM1G_10823 [Valsa mali]